MALELFANNFSFTVSSGGTTAPAAGTGVTYRAVVNGTAQATSAATTTSVVTTTYSKALAANDRVQLELVSAGTGGTDLSVVMVGKAVT